MGPGRRVAPPAQGCALAVPRVLLQGLCSAAAAQGPSQPLRSAGQVPAAGGFPFASLLAGTTASFGIPSLSA